MITFVVGCTFNSITRSTKLNLFAGTLKQWKSNAISVISRLGFDIKQPTDFYQIKHLLIAQFICWILIRHRIWIHEQNSSLDWACQRADGWGKLFFKKIRLCFCFCFCFCLFHATLKNVSKTTMFSLTSNFWIFPN